MLLLIQECVVLGKIMVIIRLCCNFPFSDSVVHVSARLDFIV